MAVVVGDLNGKDQKKGGEVRNKQEAPEALVEEMVVKRMRGWENICLFHTQLCPVAHKKDMKENH